MSTSIMTVTPPAFTETFTCNQPGCRRVFERQRDAQRHSKTHDPATKSCACPFPGCSYLTRQRTNLRTHVKTHTNTKDLSCPDCSFSTGDPAGLIRHRQKKHNYKAKTTIKRIRYSQAISPSSSPISADSSPSTAASSLPTTPTDLSPKLLTFKLESIGAGSGPDNTYAFREYGKQNATYLLPAQGSIPALQAPVPAPTNVFPASAPIVPASTTITTATPDMGSTMVWDWTPSPEADHSVYKYQPDLAYTYDASSAHGYQYQHTYAYDAPLYFEPIPAPTLDLALMYDSSAAQWDPSKLAEMQEMFGLDSDALEALQLDMSVPVPVSPTFDSPVGAQVYSLNEVVSSSEVFSSNDATYLSADMGAYPSASASTFSGYPSSIAYPSASMVYPSSSSVGYPSAQDVYSPSNDLQFNGFYAPQEDNLYVPDDSYLTDGPYTIPAYDSEATSGSQAYPSPPLY